MSNDTRIQRARRMRSRAIESGMDTGLVAATPDGALGEMLAKLLLLTPHLVDDAERREPAKVIQFRMTRRGTTTRFSPIGGDAA